MPINQSWSRILRLLVFALLFGSTLAGLFLSDKLWALWNLGDLPLWAAAAPPIMFFLFMVVFAMDRLAAVRAGTLPVHRAMFHVGTSVLFFLLLMPNVAHNGRLTVASTHGLTTHEGTGVRPARLLLAHRDRAVRAAACGLLGEALQDSARAVDKTLLELMAEHAENDRAPMVRDACRGALLMLSEGVACDELPIWPEGDAPENGDGGPEHNGEDDDEDTDSDGEMGPISL